jgi:hypothetical protein
VGGLVEAGAAAGDHRDDHDLDRDREHRQPAGARAQLRECAEPPAEQRDRRDADQQNDAQEHPAHRIGARA